MLIVISGMDGSGKTTLSKTLAARFKRSEKKVIRVECSKYFLLEPVINVFRFFMKIDGKLSTKNPILKIKQKNVLLKLWPFVVLADDLLRYYLVLKPYSMVATVICDRYFYDRLVGFKYYEFIGNSGYKCFATLIPKPDLAYILDVDPKIALSREVGEKHSLNFYTTLRNHYKKIAKEKGVKVLNTKNSIDLAVFTELATLLSR